MDYLYFLQQLRQSTPHWLNECIVFASEYIGDIGGLVLMALVYWCINKRAGTFLLMNFSLAYVCNTVVKNIFCIERPFYRDVRLEPYVKASGYSFPSGHTMLATAFYGGLAVWQRKRKWLVALCMLLTLMTAFTRNWLGVHTLEDVLVGILCSTCVIVLNSFLLQWVEGKQGRDIFVFVVTVIIFVANCVLYPTGLKSAGIYGGVMLGWLIERRFIRFEISKSIGFRVITFVAGIAVVGLLYKVLLPMMFVSFEKQVKDMLISFIAFFLVTAGWPMVLKLLSPKKSAVSG